MHVADRGGLSGLTYWYRPVALGLTVVLLALAVYALLTTAASPSGQNLIASDIVRGYLPGARRFLDTGSPFTPSQVAGPWVLDYQSFIHPPAALVLFVPFLVLPLLAWWALPLSVTAWCLWKLRPAPWTWPLMAACLLWPRSTGALLAGNTDMWAMAFVAAGAVWGWPIVGLAVKPTFAPLALVAVRSRSSWIAGGVAVVFVLVTLPAWLEWLTVVGNAELTAGYSLLNLPLVMLPVFAYVGRRVDRRRLPVSPRLS